MNIVDDSHRQLRDGDQHQRSPDNGETASLSKHAALPQDASQHSATVAGLSPTEYRNIERKMMWKIDLQVTILAAILYLLSFLDRTSIAQARRLGLMEQLHLTPHDYSVALTVLYVPYITFEIPFNLILKKVGPARLIPGVVATWGLVTTLQGIVTTRTGLFINRFFLGLTEAGILPGIVVYLTFFYKPSELQLRQAIYFSGASLAGAFGALLSAAISPLHAAGLQPWSYLFIFEGIFTVVFGLACLYLLPNGPSKLKGLSSLETAIAVDRVSRASRHRETAVLQPARGLDDQTLPPAAEASQEQSQPPSERKSLQEPRNPSQQGNADLERHLEAFRKEDVLRTLKDPFVLLLAVAHFCNAVGVYSLAFFAPSVINGLNIIGSGGRSLTLAESLLLVTPPYALAFLVSIGLAVISDRLRWRGPAYCVSFLLAILGFGLAYGGQGNAAMQYAGIMLLAAGDYSGPSVSLSWVSIGTAGHYKRATAAALMIVFTNSGGILSTWLWNGKASKGFLINLILHIVGLLTVLLTEAYVLWDRRTKAAKGQQLVQKATHRWPGASEEQIRELLGDEHPDFKLEL